MSKAKRYLTVGGTFACALATGFIMQNMADGGAGATPIQTAQAGIIPVPSQGQAELIETSLPLTDVQLTSAAPVPPAAAPQPVPLPDKPRLRAMAASATSGIAADLPVEEPAPSFSCDITLTANPAAAAMVELSLSAPCMANESFTLHHNGMMFTEVTDAEGARNLTVPALSETALYMLSFANGETAAVTAEVTSVAYYDRVVVQWQGQAGLQIHAREYGADYGQAGHVWVDAARDMAMAARGEGGFLTRHGAGAAETVRMAEVYTFPTGIAQQGGDVVLSVEAEVTELNCGRDVQAQSIEIHEGGRARVQDLVLAMPHCDATGDFLVLKNMVNDLKIARN